MREADEKGGFFFVNQKKRTAKDKRKGNAEENDVNYTHTVINKYPRKILIARVSILYEMDVKSGRENHVETNILRPRI